MKKLFALSALALSMAATPAAACIDIVYSGSLSNTINTCSQTLYFKLCVTGGPNPPCRYGDTTSGKLAPGQRNVAGISHRCAFRVSYCNYDDYKNRTCEPSRNPCND